MLLKEDKNVHVLLLIEIKDSILWINAIKAAFFYDLSGNNFYVYHIL